MSSSSRRRTEASRFFAAARLAEGEPRCGVICGFSEERRSVLSRAHRERPHSFAPTRRAPSYFSERQTSSPCNRHVTALTKTPECEDVLLLLLESTHTNLDRHRGIRPTRRRGRGHRWGNAARGDPHNPGGAPNLPCHARRDRLRASRHRFVRIEAKKALSGPPYLETLLDK